MSLFTTILKPLSFFTLLFITNLSFGQWTQSPGFNTNTHCLFSNDTMIWAGTDTGGVYRSTSNGMSWEQVNNGITRKSIKAIVRNKGRLICSDTGSFQVVKYSDNNGDKWTTAPFTSVGKVNKLIVDSIYTYAATSFGVARSHVYPEQTLTTMSTDSLPPNPKVSSVTVNGNYLFAGIYASNSGVYGVYRSSTRGQSWNSKNNGLSNAIITAMASAGGNVFAGTPGGVFISSDNGDSWTAINSGIGSTAIVSLQNVNGHMLAGTAQGIFKWMNGKWWDLTGNLPANTQVNAAVLHGGAIIIGTSNGIFSTPLGTLSLNKTEEPFFNIYPNPCSGVFNVQLDQVQNFKLEMFNTLGQQVFSTSYLNSAVESISPGELPKGLYIVKLSYNDAVVQRKLLIE